MNARTNNNSKHIFTVALLAALILVANATGASAATVYRVVAGDSLFFIAQRYGVTVSAIRGANGLVGDMIYPGQTLTIPNGVSTTPPAQSGTSYTVKSGDSLFLIARRYGTTVDALKAANGLYSEWIYPGQLLVIPSGTTISPDPNRGGTIPSRGAWSQSDLTLLAQLVTAEAGGEPYEGQVAVAATVLNRISSGLYPNTIPEVIYQVVDGRYYQYSPVLDGRINNTPSSTATGATREALNGWDPSYGALGFYNPSKTSNYWVRSRTVTRVIGDHVFFK